ncbi:hypothetical protein [Denitrobaculum tricleocarpae]|uniref:Uncharacterized protein n=1 Tax=Denitrobaculum tricleocarpae TaxID=2591009 RepID=A0A545TQQ8_9PROT|nr:hypothetical protein [Denitrobaculum tricleocarpae]TQV79548.1 hypothetical protein FKG95_12525 [Denitrobaculum tricleocarpae]
MHELGAQWPEQLFDLEIERAKSLLESGSGHFPGFAVKQVDRLSRSWLQRAGNPYLAEIDAMNDRLAAPGVYFLNINYEWGCTSGVSAAAEGGNLLRRVLDWPLDGLGAEIVAARCESAAGHWVNLTWPGFTGSIQGIAAGRFSAAIHQAPMPRRTPIMPLDWVMNRKRVWNSRAIPPAHLLRQVFETCETYADAKRILSETELALPAIFLLSGIESHEGCVIERSPTEAFLRESPAAAANHWQSQSSKASARGQLSHERSAAMLEPQIDSRLENPGHPAFNWLKPPILNDTTRLVMTANAASGELFVQGFEKPTAAGRKNAESDVAVAATAILYLGPDISPEH